MSPSETPAVALARQDEVARILATVLHAGQVDKRGAPYIEHVTRVAERFQKETSRDARPVGHVARVSAWLHDTVEDTALGIADVEALFGPAVAGAVAGLTRREEETYRDFIVRAANSSPAALAVKIADVEDHLDQRFASGLTPVRRARYEEALTVLREHLSTQG